MDLNFTCEKCGQELAGDDSMIGMEIECPSCHQAISVPGPSAEYGVSDVGGAEAYEEERPRLTVPLGSAGVSASLIKKPTSRPLNIAAKEDFTILCKTILFSSCGKDVARFDDTVGKTLEKIGKIHIISTHTVSTSDDFGVVIVYDTL